MTSLCTGRPLVVRPAPSVWEMCLGTVVDMVYPNRCAGCSFPLIAGSSLALCPGCTDAIPWLVSPFCTVCGDSFAVASEVDASAFSRRVCVNCREARPGYSVARAATTYEGVIKAAVRAFKFGGMKSLGPTLSSIMLHRADDLSEVTAGIDAVVAVPLHRKREKARGYNQSAVLAFNVARGLGVPMISGAVQRDIETPPQVGLNRRQRIENVRGSFEVSNRAAVYDRTILLIDDVMTTGATVSSCSVALMANGAREVRILALARD